MHFSVSAGEISHSSASCGVEINRDTNVSVHLFSTFSNRCVSFKFRIIKKKLKWWVLSPSPSERQKMIWTSAKYLLKPNFHIVYQLCVQNQHMHSASWRLSPSLHIIMIFLLAHLFRTVFPATNNSEPSFTNACIWWKWRQRQQRDRSELFINTLSTVGFSFWSITIKRQFRS